MPNLVEQCNEVLDNNLEHLNFEDYEKLKNGIQALEILGEWQKDRATYWKHISEAQLEALQDALEWDADFESLLGLVAHLYELSR